MGNWNSDVAAARLWLSRGPKNYIMALLKALGDKDFVREAAIDVLVQLELGQEIPQSYIEALLKALRNSDEAATHVLGQLQQATPSLIDTLLKALEDEGKHVRQEAASSLGKLSQQSLPLKNLFRFKPRLSVLHANTWDMALIQLVLRDTQGYLIQLTLGNQPVFDLTPLTNATKRL